VYTQVTYSELTMSINLAWAKLDNYYKKLNHSPAYAAALLLHSYYRLRHFENKWKGHLKKYLKQIKKATRALYDKEYTPQPIEQEENKE
jgi:hypothetical protein